MKDREKLIREAVNATVRGDRLRALQIYTGLLMHNRRDNEAREGLRRLGVPVPGEHEPEPAAITQSGQHPRTFRLPWMSATGEPAKGPRPAPEHREQEREAGSPPVYRVQPGPDYRRRAERERVALLVGLLAIMAILISLMIPSCGRLAVPLPTFTAPPTQGAVLQQASRAPPAPAAAIPQEALPQALAAAGSREQTPAGVRWSIEPPYVQSESYRASVASDMLRADPTLAQARVGSVEASRGQEGIQLVGADARRITEENWRVLASAVWRFAEHNGRFPSTLDDLVPGYLDAIPLEAVTGRADEKSAPDGKGGWSYEPPPGGKDLWAGTGASITPDLPPGTLNMPREFTPMVVKAHKASGTMEVWSGGKRLRSYPMGIGANNLTPEGTFTVDYRSALAENLPDGTPNPFGTRWLRLSVGAEAGAFGIHGSDDPGSVLEPLSLGCLRLRRGDLEDFYRLVPTGTPVTVDTL